MTAPTSRLDRAERRPAVPLSELRRTVRRYAANPNLSALLTDPDERAWARLAGDSRSDVWLVSWPEGTEAGWHDHGQADAAFAVARGTLVEETWAVGAVQRRQLVEGESRTVAAGQVHRLRGGSPGRTLTVHAYAPGLVGLDPAELREYELGASGPVRRPVPADGGAR